MLGFFVAGGAKTYQVFQGVRGAVVALKFPERSDVVNVNLVSKFLFGHAAMLAFVAVALAGRGSCRAPSWPVITNPSTLPRWTVFSASVFRQPRRVTVVIAKTVLVALKLVALALQGRTTLRTMDNDIAALPCAAFLGSGNAMLGAPFALTFGVAEKVLLLIGMTRISFKRSLAIAALHVTQALVVAVLLATYCLAGKFGAACLAAYGAIFRDKPGVARDGSAADRTRLSDHFGGHKKPPVSNDGVLVEGRPRQQEAAQTITGAHPAVKTNLPSTSAIIPRAVMNV